MGVVSLSRCLVLLSVLVSLSRRDRLAVLSSGNFLCCCLVVLPRRRRHHVVSCGLV